MQRRLTDSVSSRYCWCAVASAVAVDVGDQLTAHVSGIARCGSPWACPMCAPVVRQQRADEIGAGMLRHLEDGGSAVFVTFTVRHHQADELAGRLGVVSEVLHHVLAGSPWKRRRDRLGYVGSIKATEITYGDRNGWHPHAHALLLFDRVLTSDERNDLHVWMAGRWAGVVDRLGLGTVNGHGFDLRAVESVADLGSYLAKVDGGWSVGLELARSDRKSAAPLELLGHLVETGESRWAALWHEYERATFGKRAIVWSPGLRERLLGVEEEISDPKAAALEGSDLTLLRALISHAYWNARVRAGAQGETLTEIEQVSGLLLWLSVSAGHVVQPLDVPTGVHDAGGAEGPPESGALAGTPDRCHTLGVP